MSNPQEESAVPESDESSQGESIALRTQTVLVVDDEEDIRESLKELIEIALGGVHVHTAEGGQAALDILRNEPIDLIITDFKMPGMNGLEFLSEARKIARGVPRILITAFPDLELAIRAVNEEHIENFITKPIDATMVIEVIASILHERRAQELRNRAFARSLDMLRRQMKP